jgi:hypothetical protein
VAEVLIGRLGRSNCRAGPYSVCGGRWCVSARTAPSPALDRSIARALFTPLDVGRSLRSFRTCRWQLEDHRLLAFHQVGQQQHVAIRKL